MSEWQPIETAPRDGTMVLLAGGRTDEGCYAHRVEATALFQRPVVAFWTEYCRGWVFAHWDSEWNGEYLNPTHWMPLPKPPEPAP